MGFRYNSPTSINTSNGCKRRYYNRYKGRLREKNCMALIGGNVVHQAIEMKIANQADDTEMIFEKTWSDAEPEMLKLGLSKGEIKAYREDYWKMMLNWEKDFDPSVKTSCEVKLKSDKYRVMGIIDELSTKNGKVRIMDNKTSRSDWMTKEHEVQLGIYALLFQDKYQKLPDYAGIRFLRTGTKKYIPVDEKLLGKARYECQMARIRHISEDIENYPKNPPVQCKWWRNGQCPCYEKC